MTNCCYTGALAKFKIATQWIDFVSFEPYEVFQHLTDGSAESIRGDLEHLDTDVDVGPLFVKYKLTIQLTPQKLTILLPLISGTTTNPITNAAAPANTWFSSSVLTLFDSKLETPNGSLFTFTNCMVNGWSIQGRKASGPIRMVLDIWASSMTPTAAGVETWSNIMTGTVYGFTRGILNIGGSAYAYDQFSLDANYRLIYQHNNSTTVTTICPSDSVAQFQTSIPYNACASTTGLLTTSWAADPVQEASAFLDFNRSSHETKITMAEIMSVGRMPAINKFNEVRLPYQANVYKSATVPMFTFLNL